MSRVRAQIARALATASRTIAPAERREAKGIVEGTAYEWNGSKCRNPKGGTYTTTESCCSCPDWERHRGECKHMRASRIYGPQAARTAAIRARKAQLFGERSA